MLSPRYLLRGTTYDMKPISLVVKAGLLAAGLVLAAPPALAKAPKLNPEAAKLAKEGKKLLKKKKFAEAITAFEGAYEADPQPGLLLELGTAQSKAGDLPAAAATLEKLDKEGAADKKAQKKGAKLLAKVNKGLAKSFVKVLVTSKPSGADLELESADHQTTGKTPFQGWLPFGDYRVGLEKEGFEPHKATLAVAADQPAELKVELVEAKAEEPEPEVEPEVEPEEEAAEGDELAEDDLGEEAEQEAAPRPPAEGGSKLPAIACLGAGAAFVAGGAVFGWLNGSAKDRLDEAKKKTVTKAELDKDAEEADSDALIANILFGVGGAALATGVALWLLSGDAPEPGAGGDAGLLRVWVAPAPDGMGLVLEGTL